MKRWVFSMALGWLGMLIAPERIAAEGGRGDGRYNQFNLSNSIVPVVEIIETGLARDAIPAIDRPHFLSVEQVDYLDADDLILSLPNDGLARAYPLKILDHHEVVNDVLAGRAIAVTYCPLCGTAMVFDRTISGVLRTFGVSGLLYQSDVLLYDRETETLWSQLAMKALAGYDARATLDLLPSEQMTWAAWQERFPSGLVLSNQNEGGFDYATEAYESYRNSDRLLYPAPQTRIELPNKAWVIGVLINGRAKAYALHDLSKLAALHDRFQGVDLVITYQSAEQWANVRSTTDRQKIQSIRAYWFAWQAFYPDTQLWGRGAR